MLFRSHTQLTSSVQWTSQTHPSSGMGERFIIHDGITAPTKSLVSAPPSSENSSKLIPSPQSYTHITAESHYPPHIPTHTLSHTHGHTNWYSYTHTLGSHTHTDGLYSVVLMCLEGHPISGHERIHTNSTTVCVRV